jgi:hypothetical protein
MTFPGGGGSWVARVASAWQKNRLNLLTYGEGLGIQLSELLS